MERFLYRLAQSPHADRFVLKGSLLLRVWRFADNRPTMDIDMLGRTDNDESQIADQIQEIMSQPVEPDGLELVPGSIRTQRITETAEYNGVRVRLGCMLGSARIELQVDIGFGDVVHPEPEHATLPVLLDAPAPRLLCYSRESVIAEKLEAMLKLGSLNSRMKDFHDIWLLSRQCDFSGPILASAIRQTLEQRGTALPHEMPSFTMPFIAAKQVQWTAFRKRLAQDHVPADFADVVSSLERFLLPLIRALRGTDPLPDQWTAPGPWVWL